MILRGFRFFIKKKGVQINSTKRVPDEVFVWYTNLVPGTRVLFSRFRTFPALILQNSKSAGFIYGFPTYLGPQQFQILNLYREGRGWEEATISVVGVGVEAARRVYPCITCSTLQNGTFRKGSDNV
jgi:hypothetical protein